MFFLAFIRRLAAFWALVLAGCGVVVYGAEFFDPASLIGRSAHRAAAAIVDGFASSAGAFLAWALFAAFVVYAVWGVAGTVWSVFRFSALDVDYKGNQRPPEVARRETK